MTNTVNNGIPYVPENTIDPAAGLNISLNTIDALTQCRVISIGENDPPLIKTDGDRYIVGSAPTGDWSADANRLAVWLDGAWDFYDAWIVLNASDNRLYKKNDSGAWSQVESGVFMRGTWEELLAAGAAFEIPHGAIVECTDWPDKGVGVNSYWRTVVVHPLITILTPMAGLLLAGQSSPVAVAGVTTEEVLFQLAVKRFMLYGGQAVELKTKLSKSDAVNAATFRVYCGRNGDISDALIQEIVFPAGDRVAVINTDAFFGDVTECTVAPVKTDGSYDVSLPYPAAVTVDDTTVNDIFITATIQNSDEDLEVRLAHSSSKILVL